MPGNFDIVIEEIGVDVKGLQRAKASLLALSEDTEKETYISVTKIARKGGDILRDEVPVGETGNLRAAVYSDLLATKFTGRWEARAGISNRPVSYFPGRRERGLTDPPIFYALAINSGRRALSKPGDNRVIGNVRGPAPNYFAWYNKGALNSKGEPKKATGKFNYNVFTQNLAPRKGSGFLNEAHRKLIVYVEGEELQSYVRRLRRGRLGARRGALAGLEQFSGSNFPRNIF